MENEWLWLGILLIRTTAHSIDGGVAVYVQEN